MRPTLRQIEYFLAIADQRSFRRAAEDLAVTQPSLSKQISALEADLGVRLFERVSRTVSLTPAGQALEQDARQLIHHAQAFKNKARQLAQRHDYHLTAGVLPSIGAYFMPRFTERLRQTFPQLQISFVEGPSQELSSKLGDGELDFVMASTVEDTQFRVKPLFEETLWVCSTPDDALMQDRSPAPLSALRDRTLLTLSPDFHLAQIVANLAKKAGARLSEAYRGSSLDAIRQMAANGPGVAVLPSLYALGEAIRDPKFRVRRLDDAAALHPVFLYWRRTAPDPGLYEALARDIIAEKCAIRAERAPQFQVPQPIDAS